jgi:membrane dipeptidase
VEEIRKYEFGLNDKPDRMKGTVSISEMRKGKIGLCVATQIARYVKPENALPGWKSPQQAWAMTQGQLAWYRSMEQIKQMIQITDLNQLEKHLLLWNNPPDDAPIGYILSLEGADSLYEISLLEKAWKDGLRIIGPAHYGPGTYAQGTEASGGLSSKGREFIREMDRMHFILDVSHLNDACFREALDQFRGPVWASHNNCRAFVNHTRQLTDEQIGELIKREAVIGVAADAWMLVPDWERGKSTPASTGVSLNHMVNNIDHICQLAGNTLHAAIGSDLDGAFGTEQGPVEINTIADLQKIPSLLKDRGYSAQDIENILSVNWIRFLRNAWKVHH